MASEEIDNITVRYSMLHSLSISMSYTEHPPYPGHAGSDSSQNE